MLTEAHFLSVKEAKQLKPDSATVVISILDRSEEQDRPQHLAQFRDHLVLCFEDVYEEMNAAFDGTLWPDELSEQEHLLVTMGRGEKAPELSDAKQIVDFIYKHHRQAERVRLVVHCHGGISRSAAVAEWVAVACGVPLPQLGRDGRTTDGANKRLMRLMNKAAGRF